MSNYYPNFASPDSDPIDYYYDMSGEDCPLGEESRNATSIPSWTRRTGTSAFAATIFVLISGSLLIVGLAAILDLQHQHTFAKFDIGSSGSNNRETYDASIQEEPGEGGYGVDVSWPIEGPLHMHKEPFVFGEGTRHNAYMEHLQGCRSFYKQVSQTAARTCDLFEFDRLLMNKRQPQSMKNYTDVGFKKIQAPPRVAQIIENFWQQNKEKQGTEAWPEGNIYLNHWASPSTMISVDDAGLRGSGIELKRNLWEATQTTISEWTGGQAISPVSMYGIRVYHNNSVLVPHVDRLPLVASAMINVAQDVEEDWPIEIYDHDGMAHNVTLQPGDMLLFESHSVIHGRPFAMKGNFYAMLFIHFEPTGQTALRQKDTVDEQYRQAIQDGVGGQSSSEQASMLPPYIRRFSPEEEHWQQQHPEGWRPPASSPDSFGGENVNGGEKDATQEQKDEIHIQSDAHQAARNGDLVFWTDALAAATTDEEKNSLVNKRDSFGWQPVHEGAVHGRQEIVELLLNHGANINARTSGGRGGTALFLAEQKLGIEHSIVHYLTNHGALSISPDRSFRDEL